MSINKTRFITCFCCLLFLTLIISCSTKVTHVESDPSFTPNSLAGRAVAILGCTTITEEVPNDIWLSVQLSPHLERALQEELAAKEEEIADKLQELKHHISKL